MVATRTGPSLPLWSPHLAAGRSTYLMGWFFLLLKVTLLGVAILNLSALTLLFLESFPSSQDRLQSGSNIFQRLPSLFTARMNHTGSLGFFVHRTITYIVLYHKRNIYLW